MVAEVRRGASLRSVARDFGVHLRTVQRWIERAGEERLDRVDWSDHPSTPGRTGRIDRALEDLILEVRREFKEQSVLGEYGALAVHRRLSELQAAGEMRVVPSVRTIGRTFERRGVLDARRRVRRAAPPAGWYLPELAARRVELDSFDVIEGLRFEGGRDVEILTGISLHGGLTGAWPTETVTSSHTMAALEAHWRVHGLPGFAQFDNDTRFHGSHGYADLFGRLVRMCLSLAVVPVFAPPRETGFQASIESFNGRWQAKVWRRIWVDGLTELRTHCDRYIAASHTRSAVRIEAAPERTPFPDAWEFDPRARPTGRIVYVRRTTESGATQLLGRTFEIDRHWVHRLVRGEVDLTLGRIRFYALRRRDPGDQPLLREHPYEPRIERIWRRRQGGGTVNETHFE